VAVAAPCSPLNKLFIEMNTPSWIPNRNATAANVSCMSVKEALK
jgi:hypothetical protein